jgi:hypothetical protein
MKKGFSLLHVIILSLMTLSIILMGCDWFTTTDPENERPEIRTITAGPAKIPAGGTTTVTVTTVDAEGDAVSFKWSCASGTFADDTVNPATWTAPDEGGTFQLRCKVSDADGDRSAYVKVTVVKLETPEGAVAWWSFEEDFTDAIGGYDGEAGDGVTVQTEESAHGFGSAMFDGTEEAYIFAPGEELGMGPDDDYTFTLWVKLEAPGFIFGKTWEGWFGEGAPGLVLEEYGDVYMGFLVAWWDEMFEDAGDVLDGEWHHIAVVKEDGVYTVYLDGEELMSAELETADNEDMVITMGGADDGYGWPGAIEGYMDDVRFYDYALTAEEIDAIANE